MPSTAALPVLCVPGSPTSALTLESLAQLPGDALARWLAARRWFGAKGTTPTAVRVARLVPLPWADGRFAIARLEVDIGGGIREYQLPLGVRGSAFGDEGETTEPIARIESSAGEAFLIDAVHDARFRRALADSFGIPDDVPGHYGVKFAGAATKWIVESEGENALVVPASAPITLGSAEQSNTSIVLGREAMLKLFRRLEPGVNPDVEITRFLTLRAGFTNTPVLLGSVRFEDGDGETVRRVAGMLQEYVADARDGWSWVLAEGTAYFRAPVGKEPQNAVARALERLGAVTRGMHDALASEAASEAGPDFEPEPADAGDVERWALHAERQIHDALELLARRIEAGALPPERVPEARALAERGARYTAEVDALVDAIGDDAGFCIRHHGDYHLGQVLRAARGDFMIIDFEGEPARPLEERRRKQSALRDVAGMLRSFAYAAATLATDAGAALDVPTRERRSARWEREAREAFLNGYGMRGAESGVGRGEESDFLPEEPENVKRLITLFETEKAFYELAYELNNRPEWAWIPMRGISKLLA